MFLIRTAYSSTCRVRRISRWALDTICLPSWGSRVSNEVRNVYRSMSATTGCWYTPRGATLCSFGAKERNIAAGWSGRPPGRARWRRTPLHLIKPYDPGQMCHQTVPLFRTDNNPGPLPRRNAGGVQDAEAEGGRAWRSGE